MNGLMAMEGGHRALIDESVRSDFADSLNLDTSLREAHPDENRWDYLLGHGPSRSVIGLEPHSAKKDEISTVIAKRRSALIHLRKHLKPGRSIAAWLWVASGRVHFANTEKARLQLDQNGITFVGKLVLNRHLPTNPKRTS